MFGLAVDNWSSTVGTAHTAGDGQIVLAALNGLPALPAGRIYRATAISAAGTPTEAILGVFEATGLTGLALTGVTASAGYTDANLAAGVTLEIRVCKATVAELQAAIDTVNGSAAFLAGAAFTGAVSAPGFSGSGAGLAGVVHTTGDETVAGNKTFTGAVTELDGRLTITGATSGGPNIQLNGYNWYICTLGDNSWGLAVANTGSSYYVQVNYVANGTSDTRAGFFDMAAGAWVAYGDTNSNFHVAHNLMVAGTIATGSGATGARPAAPAIGAQWYDSTLHKPVWWDGSAWRDASGTVV